MTDKYFVAMTFGSSGNPPTDIHTLTDITQESYSEKDALALVKEHCVKDADVFCKPRDAYLIRDHGLFWNGFRRHWPSLGLEKQMDPENVAEIFSSATARDEYLKQNPVSDPPKISASKTLIGPTIYKCTGNSACFKIMRFGLLKR